MSGARKGGDSHHPSNGTQSSSNRRKRVKDYRSKSYAKPYLSIGKREDLINFLTSSSSSNLKSDSRGNSPYKQSSAALYEKVVSASRGKPHGATAHHHGAIRKSIGSAVALDTSIASS
jgi:hypothetical protein